MFIICQMDKYFLCDVIYNILNYLNKDYSFNFLNVCKYMANHKHFIYNKYVFNYGSILESNEFNKCIRTLRINPLYYDNWILNNLNLNNLATLEIISNYRNYKRPSKIEIFVSTVIHYAFTFINNMFLNLSALNYLPETLQTLTINYDFDKPIDNLPTNLKILNITSDIFNQSLNNLPKNLTVLNLHCYKLNKSLDDLPIFLESLTIFSHHFNQPALKLPLNLTSLALYTSSLHISLNLNYLCNLSTLKIYNNLPIINNFPENIIELQLATFMSHEAWPNLLSRLPNNLKILKLNCDNFNSPLNTLPKNLECLILYSKKFNHAINNLPKTLKILKIESAIFNKSLNDLPKSLSELQISSNSFNGSLNHLPNNLETLKISSDIFNNPIYNLPQPLKTLILNCEKFKEPCLLPNRPNSLTNLKLNRQVLHCKPDWCYDEFRIDCKWHF